MSCDFYLSRVWVLHTQPLFSSIKFFKVIIISFRKLFYWSNTKKHISHRVAKSVFNQQRNVSSPPYIRTDKINSSLRLINRRMRREIDTNRKNISINSSAISLKIEGYYFACQFL